MPKYCCYNTSWRTVDYTWLRDKSDDTNIVFIHGVNSSDACWKHDNGTYWPELLKSNFDSSEFSKLSQAGIYVYNYQTDIFSGSYQLGDVVDELKERLRLDNVFETKRLVFVCHSMGGIVARRLLVQRAKDFEPVQIGLFLIASPSLGSKYANLVSGLAKLIRYRQPDVLRFSQNNTWLNDLDTDFMNLRDSGQIQFFGKEIIEDKFISYRKFGIFPQIVEPFSGARYFGEAIKISHSDHFTIAKPENKEALQHRLLVKFIEDFIEDSNGQTEVNIGQVKTDTKSNLLYVPDFVNDVLQYNGIKPSLVGRDAELALLNDFATCDGDFKWWMVQGRGGIGKSKLAFSFIHILLAKSEIEVGYVRVSDLERDWKNWQPQRNTFMVIDNAAEQIDLVKKIIEGLIQRKLNYEVRLLLVERLGTSQLENLNKNTYIDYRFKDVYEIMLLQDEYSLKAIASELGVELKDEFIKGLNSFSKGIPLYTVLALAGSDRNASVEALLDEQIQRLKRQVSGDLSQNEFYLLAMAVLTIGLPWGSFPEKEANVSKISLENFTGQNCTIEIAPLQPDVFGGYLLLSVLEQMSHPEIIDFVSKAWLVKPEPTMIALLRLQNDFATQKKYQRMSDSIHTVPQIEQGVPKSRIKGTLKFWMLFRTDLINRTTQVTQIHSIYEELKTVAKTLEEEVEIQVVLAIGAFNALTKCGKLLKLDEIDQYFDELETVAQAYPEEIEIQLRFVNGLLNAVTFYEDAKNFDKSEHYFVILKDVASAYQEEVDIQLGLADCVVNTVNAYGFVKKFHKLERYFSELKTVALANPEVPEIQLALARGAVNAVGHYGTAENFKKVEEYISELKTIAATYPREERIQGALAQGLGNVVVDYGKARNLSKLEQHYSELKAVADTNPEEIQLQLFLAKAAVNVLLTFDKVGRHDEIPPLLKIIKKNEGVLRRAFSDMHVDYILGEYQVDNVDETKL